MSTDFYSFRSLEKCKQTFLCLALCAVLSAGFGLLIAASADRSYFLMMRMATRCRVSIVGSALCTFLPFLVSVYFIVHSKPWLAYFVCAVHLTLFTCVGFAVQLIYPKSDWLVRLMLQFPQICLIPMLLYLLVQRFTASVSRRTVILGISIAALVGLINSYVISPFLAELMTTYDTMGRYATHAGLDWCL